MITDSCVALHPRMDAIHLAVGEALALVRRHVDTQIYPSDMVALEYWRRRTVNDDHLCVYGEPLQVRGQLLQSVVALPAGAEGRK